jgi:hypothetical protein
LRTKRSSTSSPTFVGGGQTEGQPLGHRVDHALSDLRMLAQVGGIDGEAALHALDAGACHVENQGEALLPELRGLAGVDGHHVHPSLRQGSCQRARAAAQLDEADPASRRIDAEVVQREVRIDPGAGADPRDAEALAFEVLRGPDLRPGDQLRRHAGRVHRHQQFQVAAFGHGLQDGRHADDAARHDANSRLTSFIRPRHH